MLISLQVNALYLQVREAYLFSIYLARKPRCQAPAEGRPCNNQQHCSSKQAISSYSTWSGHSQKEIIVSLGALLPFKGTIPFHPLHRA